MTSQEKSMIKLTVFLPPEHYEILQRIKLQRLRAGDRTSLNKLIQEAVKNYLEGLNGR